MAGADSEPVAGVEERREERQADHMVEMRVAQQYVGFQRPPAG